MKKDYMLKYLYLSEKTTGNRLEIKNLYISVKTFYLVGLAGLEPATP